jgi:regulatory protein
MASTGSPRTPRPARKARPRISLKMQAIGFLSRREHSRQELRAKLLAALRKRERDQAQLAAEAEAAAREITEALALQPSNGIDDAFAPPLPLPLPLPPTLVESSFAASRTRGGSSRSAREAATSGDALAARGGRSAMADPATRAQAAMGEGARVTATSSILDSLRLASGDVLPAHLRTNPVLAAPAAGASTGEALRTFGGASAHGGEKAVRGKIGIGIDDAMDSAAPPSADVGEADLELTDPEAAVDQLLDWLSANGYLSDARFVESRVDARARKQGATRIRHELSRHGLTLEPDQAAKLRETEFARAQAVWQRKFGEVGVDARARAKQARFLAARGFASDVVRRIVGGEEEF